jgi:DNA-binding NarL/FixJ family response regulator
VAPPLPGGLNPESQGVALPESARNEHAFPTAALHPVLVVEDSSPTRERLRRILVDNGTPADGIWFATSVAEARRAVRARQFELVLVDIGLPDGSGVDLISHLYASRPEVPSVVVSAFGAEDTILAALRAGAVGYLLKEREDIEIALSLRSIAQGGAPIDPFIAKRILGLLAAPARSAQQPAAGDNPLTDRELQVLDLVAQGLTNAEIAEAMTLSRLTVESHTKNIYRKLVVGSRTQAVYEARQKGWLP